jgi:putative molybdopterin biosynthesis protein
VTTGERFMDTQQVAKYLGVHEKQVYTLIHDRGLPATKITGKWLFPIHLVDRWLESNVINMPEAEPFLKAAGSLLLIAGSDDPLLVKLTALFNKRFPDMLVLQSRAGSRDGMMALKKGLVHIACVHLVDPQGGYATGHIREYLGDDIAVITFAERTQGVLLGPGNPQAISSLSDAFEKELRWAVREVGTGTRTLMDMEMDRLGVDPDPVLARSVPAQSHLDAALTIHSGQGDAGFGIEAAAYLSGCDFLPVRKERFDLIVKKENFFLPQVQDLLALLREEVFEEMAEELTGYDLKESGVIRV